MIMALGNYAKKLAKLLDYALGRNPDEFGLVPDGDGFVKLKELLKALHEEDGWKAVRKAGIDEVMYSIADPPVEINKDRIRAMQERKAGRSADMQLNRPCCFIPAFVGGPIPMP
jgi:RNA:NAD 2'-phosphotransferase (TPT1/KptA family)